MENLIRQFKKEADPCHAAGCPGVCCISPHIIMKDSVRRRLFPNALQVADELDFKDQIISKGVYWKNTGYRTETGFEKLVELKVVGMPCPHKKGNGGCNVYNQRPDGCKYFDFAGPACDEVRVEADLAPIRKIKIANIPKNQDLEPIIEKGGD